jgi:hypothetical protein
MTKIKILSWTTLCLCLSVAAPRAAGAGGLPPAAGVGTATSLREARERLLARWMVRAYLRQAAEAEAGKDMEPAMAEEVA